MPKPKRKSYLNMPGSTEAQARAFMASMKRPAPEPIRDTGGKTTAKTPANVLKTETEGAKEKAALRKKIAARIADEKKKKK